MKKNSSINLEKCNEQVIQDGTSSSIGTLIVKTQKTEHTTKH